MSDELGKFGHHPEPEIDAEVEIERLIGCLATAHAGLRRALDYRTATLHGLDIKNDVRWSLKESGFAGELGCAE